MDQNEILNYAITGIEKSIGILNIKINGCKSEIRKARNYDGHFTTAWEAREIMKTMPNALERLEDQMKVLEAKKEEMKKRIRK